MSEFSMDAGFSQRMEADFGFDWITLIPLVIGLFQQCRNPPQPTPVERAKRLQMLANQSWNGSRYDNQTVHRLARGIRRERDCDKETAQGMALELLDAGREETLENIAAAVAESGA